MKRLKSFMGLMMAAAITALSAQAQDAVTQAKAPVDQDAPASVATKAVKGETVTQRATGTRSLTPVSDYKASETRVATRAARKAPARKVSSVNELQGTYVLTGTSMLTAGYNGLSVSVEAAGNDSIAINNFWSSGYSTVVKGKVDVTTGTISFPSCVMGQHSTYGDILFAKTNTADGQPVESEEVTATVGEDGTIAFNDAWGAYVKASSSATSWSYFSIVNNATLEKCNATFTGLNHSDSTLTTYGLVFTQTGDNVATVKNLGNYGQTVSIELNRNNTASIPSSLIAYNSTYGDFYSYNLTFTSTGASLGSGDAVTDVAVDNRTLSWKNWGVVTGSTSGSRYLVAAYDSCAINTTSDITYPVLSVTEWEGEGTEASPYLIKQRDDLILLSDKVAEVTEYDCTTPPSTTAYCRPFLGTYFKVVNDIDMENYRFTPIGADWNHLFAGNFDGDGHTISNLNVNVSGSYAGLFGRTDTVAVVKNINFDNATVVASSGFVGAVAGWAIGKIENVTVQNSTFQGGSYCVAPVAGISYDMTNVTVTDCEVTNTYGYTGGIVGEAHGPLTNCVATGVNITSSSASSSSPGMPVGGVAGNLYMTTMENCYFAGLIDASSTYSEYQTAGGLAGWATGSTIKNSFAVGNIQTYSSGSVAGGLVGFLRGSIENSYFNGRVYGYSSRNTGGAVGRVSNYILVSGGDTIQSSLTNVYSAATVAAETYQYQSQANEQNNEIIGVIVEGSKPTISNVYFDKQMVSLTKSQYGVNTSELVSAQGPTGFDASVWSFNGSTYPVLKWAENTPASLLSAAAIVMPEGSTMDKFTKDATINKGGDNVVTFFKSGALSNTGYYATIANNQITLNTEMQFGNDTIYYLSPAIGVYYYRVAKIAPIPYEGSGDEDNPFLIKTKSDLVLLSQFTTVSKQLFPDTYFKVVNDIDLELDESFLGICTDASDAHNYFAGTIDGDGHYIHRMKFNNVAWSSQPETGWGTINTTDSKAYKGFVGRLDAAGAVKNLNIASDCDLHFYASSGAVVGYNSGLVENCRNYADVVGNSCWIGGVVGQNLKEGKIINCYNEGTVTGGYGQTGGIAGATYSLIQNCMNVGRVEIRQLATNYANQLQSCGGIVGTASAGGKFVNCVNAGTVSAQLKRAGGIAGYWSPVSATSTASYYTNDMNNVVNYGTVITADQSTIGAIAGGENQSTSEDISGVYWDVQLLDIPADCNAAHEGMNGVETAVLTSGTALEGFDTEVWQFEAGKYPVLKQFASEPMVQQAATVQLTIPTGVTTKNLSADAVITAGTPTLAQGTQFTLEGNVLKGLPTTDVVVNDTLTVVSDGYVKIIPISAMPVIPLEGEGTEQNPYRITNANEWNALATFISNTANDLTGKYVVLANDIDFTGVEEGIIPQGADGITGFNGNMNGQGYTVSGYDHTTTAAGEGGLFGTVGAEGVVKNLTANGAVTGGLGGTNGKTKLGYVGGIVGKLYGKMENCVSKGTVTGIGTYTGGVAGYVYQGAELKDVTNEATVTSAAAYVGGIAAYAYEETTFDHCVNKGNLSSTVAAGYVGGIAATALPTTFNECVNEGNISAGSSAGIVANCPGKASSGAYTFNECVNEGEITGNGILGGITAVQGTTVGNNACNYIRCENWGDITATATAAVSSSSMAGIAAFYSAGSTFDHCVNYGYVTNTKSVYTAGIAGYYKGTPNATYPVSFQGCENYGNIASQAQQIAGIVAFVTNYTTIDSCYNEGNIEQGLWGAAGICYTFTGANSVLTNCVNKGDVTVAQYNAGGIIGNNANVNSVIDGCVNLGNISTTSTAETNNYGVGGIAAAAYTNVTNCLNAGKVSGKVRVGGIVGSPSYNANTVRTRITNCVNTGEVVADEGCGGPIVGTVAGSEATYWGDNNECTGTYYLNDQSWRNEAAPSVGDYVAVGTGLGVADLAGFDMNGDEGTSWYTADEYSFPVPAIGESNASVLSHAAAVVLAEGDTYDNVTYYKFNVGNPEGTLWIPSSEIVVIDGNNAQVTEVSQIEVILTVSDESIVGAPSKAPSVKEALDNANVEWKLKLNVDDVTGINDNTIGKVVAQEAYYTINGVLVEKPSASDGQLYIVVRKYTDGSMNAIKVRN